MEHVSDARGNDMEAEHDGATISTSFQTKGEHKTETHRDEDDDDNAEDEADTTDVKDTGGSGKGRADTFALVASELMSSSGTVMMVDRLIPFW